METSKKVSMMQAMDRLDKVMRAWQDNQSTIIKPTLHRRGNGPNYWWRLQLVEDREPNTYHTSHLDESVEWTDSQLKSWPNCERKAWDIWDFKHRRDAEKFITLFHLSWAQ
jgi:hypothetical protein